MYWFVGLGENDWDIGSGYHETKEESSLVQKDCMGTEVSEV